MLVVLDGDRLVDVRLDAPCRHRQCHFPTQVLPDRPSAMSRWLQSAPVPIVARIRPGEQPV